MSFSLSGRDRWTGHGEASLHEQRLVRNSVGERKFGRSWGGWEEDPGLGRTAECPYYSPSADSMEAGGKRGGPALACGDTAASGREEACPGREQDSPTLQCRTQSVCACGLKRTRRSSDSRGWGLEGHPKSATNTDSTFRGEAPAPWVALRNYGSRDTVRRAEAVHTPATVGMRGTPLGSLCLAGRGLLPRAEVLTIQGREPGSEHWVMTPCDLRVDTLP